MTLIFLLYVVAVLWGIRFARRNEFHTCYCELGPSNAIKGSFVMLVFFRHFVQYVELNRAMDKIFYYINGCLGQMIVVPFLFFSGYGLMHSISQKGMAYVKTIPAKRALRVWVHYMLALFLFLAARMLIGKKTPLKQFLLTMVCYKSIGNSNWYVLAIILCYLFTWIAFSFFPKDNKRAALLQTGLIVVSIALMSRVLPGRYCNTLLSCPAGIWYYLYRDKIENFLWKKESRYYTVSAVVFILCILTNWKRGWSVALYSAAAVLFAWSVLLVTMKLQINNKFLQYMGGHVFSLYILQRLPMMVLSNTTNLAQSPYIFFFVSLFLTFLISWLFDEAVKRFDKVVF